MRAAVFAGLAVIQLLLVGAASEEQRMSAEALIAAVERGPGPSRGSADAPVTIVEFSDFQCSFCRKFWKETLPLIEERYIRTGRVRFVYRHLALLGEFSVKAAEAAECAQEQGKFWAYHDLLFARAGPFAFTTPRLKAYAQELGLDPRNLATCLESGRHRRRVEAETLVAGYLGAAATPTFLINGKRLVGAHPFETFADIIETELAAKQGRRHTPGR